MYEYPSSKQAMGYRPSPTSGLGVVRQNEDQQKLMQLIEKEMGQIQRGKDGGIGQNLAKMEKFDDYLRALRGGGPEADELVNMWKGGKLDGLWSGYAQAGKPMMPPAWS